MVDCILSGQVGRYEHVRTVGDQMLFRMSWLYDMNFAWTFQQVRQRRFLEQMSSKMPDDERLKAVVEHLQTVRDQRG